jgi:hypothetical protein
MLTSRFHSESVEDLVYGTPPPEEASYNQAAYAEAYASYQCAYDSQTFPPPTTPFTDSIISYQTTLPPTITTLPTEFLPIHRGLDQWAKSLVHRSRHDFTA